MKVKVEVNPGLAHVLACTCGDGSYSFERSQRGFPDTLVLARDRAEDVFSDRRLEIVDYLKEHSPRSVRALADSLGYDKGVVSRDLRKLAELDVIEYEENGERKHRGSSIVTSLSGRSFECGSQLFYARTTGAVVRSS